jgi:TldD protein
MSDSARLWVLFEESRQAAVLRIAGGSILDCAASASVGLSYTEFGSTRRVIGASTTDALRTMGVAPARLALHDGVPSVDRDASLGAATAELLALAESIDAEARSYHNAIVNVVLEAEFSTQAISITADGEHRGHDVRHVVYVTARAIAEAGGRRATGFHTPGVTGAPAALDAREIGREVAGRAYAALAAVPAPGGRLPVIIGPGRGAVLIHEACCHSVEGDEVLRDSIYAARLGELVARPGVTITDDPTLPSGVGSYRIDDEGVTAVPTDIVTEGRLSSFLLDRGTAAALGQAPTGNGRRDGWRRPVLPRMSNTVVRPGTHTPEELVSSVRDGIFAQHVGGGQVTEQTGEFVFRVMNAYRVRDGKLAEPLRETTIAGLGQQVLQEIDGVADDPRLGAAKCGKHGQLIPVGVCGPTMLIRGLMVGAS